MGGVKIMEKGFYHSSRGYWQTNSEVSDEVIASYPDGTIEVALKPSRLHTFNGTEWVAPTQAELDAEAEAMVRGQRDNLLATEVDPIVANPLRWADLSATEQLEIATYRTALLDITSQAGFPHNVIWPTL